MARPWSVTGRRPRPASSASGGEPTQKANGSSAARFGFEDGHNLLRVEQGPDFGVRAAALAGETASALLEEHGIKPIDVDLVVANPLMPAFLEGLSEHVGIEPERVVTVEGAEHAHTAGLLVALAGAEEQGRLRGADRILLVSAGAGITAGAAILLR